MTGNPAVMTCYRYDVGMNCTASTIISYHLTGFPYYQFPNPIPACPDTNQIDTFPMYWATYVSNGTATDVNWLAIGGTILSQTRTAQGASGYDDTLVIQWNGYGPQGLRGTFEVAGGGWGPAYCNYPVYFWPSGGGALITGPDRGCDTTSVRTYSTVNTAGYTYNWIATNGTILSGQGTSSVDVRWHGNGSLSVEKASTSCNTTYTDNLNFQAFLGTLSLGIDKDICSDGSTTLSGPGGQASYQWSTGSAFPSITVNTPGTYSLQVVDQNGCAHYDAVTVNGIACVFPGDANYDGVADNQDVLTIGAYASRTGPTRANASTAWIGQPATDWGNPLPATADPKHSDCDGNGTVNAGDTMAVMLNYGQTHTKSTGGSATGPTLRIASLQDTVAPGDLAWFVVELGDAGQPADSVYGLAFTVNYDTAATDPQGLLQVDYTNCWFAAVNQRIPFTRNHFPAAEVDVAVVRNDQVNAQGFGEVCRFAILTDSIPNPGATTLTAWLSGVVLVDAELQSKQVSIEADSVVVMTAPSVHTSDPALALPVKIGPNPANDHLNIVQEGALLKSVTLFDLSGKLLWSETVARRSSLSIPISEFAEGMYLVRIATNKGSYLQKLIIQH